MESAQHHVWNWYLWFLVEFSLSVMDLVKNRWMCRLITSAGSRRLTHHSNWPFTRFSCLHHHIVYSTQPSLSECSLTPAQVLRLRLWIESDQRASVNFYLILDNSKIINFEWSAAYLPQTVEIKCSKCLLQNQPQIRGHKAK